ncbi:unnamed protein product [Citrullus colocynthis]|uniref:Secreted protein n=1 Tax=Citrullus colocynthis TaxID=252529 RepID=A0ABP0XV13_9ROSI
MFPQCFILSLSFVAGLRCSPEVRSEPSISWIHRKLMGFVRGFVQWAFKSDAWVSNGVFRLRSGLPEWLLGCSIRRRSPVLEVALDVGLCRWL